MSTSEYRFAAMLGFCIAAIVAGCAKPDDVGAINSLAVSRAESISTATSALRSLEKADVAAARSLLKAHIETELDELKSERSGPGHSQTRVIDEAIQAAESYLNGSVGRSPIDRVLGGLEAPQRYELFGKQDSLIVALYPGGRAGLTYAALPSDSVISTFLADEARWTPCGEHEKQKVTAANPVPDGCLVIETMGWDRIGEARFAFMFEKTADRLTLIDENGPVHVLARAAERATPTPNDPDPSSPATPR